MSRRLYVEVFTTDQYTAGLADVDLINAYVKNNHPAVVEARVFGRPASFNEFGIFDPNQIAKMYDEAAAPKFTGELRLKGERAFASGEDIKKLIRVGGFQQKLRLIKGGGNFSFWHMPNPRYQYVIGADVAQGMTGRDYSCASVLCVRKCGTHHTFTEVAKYYGHINSFEYGYALIKLSMMYNNAILIPERRGPGDATIKCIKDVGYPYLFRDETDPSRVQFVANSLFGIDTNVKTKGLIVALLQNAIWDETMHKRRLRVYDKSAIDELSQFGQEETPSKLSHRFRGQGGSHDDKVMAVAIAIYAVITYNHIYGFGREKAKRKTEKLSQADEQFWDNVRRERKTLSDTERQFGR